MNKIVIVPGARSEQVIMSNILAEEQVGSFSMLYVNSLENFNPDTFDMNVQTAMLKIYPELYPKLRSIYKKLSSQIKQSQLSSHFVCLRNNLRIEHFDNTLGKYEVVIKGERNTYSKGKQIGRQKVQYALEISRDHPTDLNPYGLFVSKQKISIQNTDIEND